MRCQTLRGEFDSLKMREFEEYFNRTIWIVNEHLLSGEKNI